MKFKFLLIVLFFLQGCYKEDFDPHYKYLIKRKDLTSFSLEADKNLNRILEDVEFNIELNKISAFIPYYIKKDSLIVTFTTNGELVYVNDSLQTSGVTANDFTKPVTYIVEAKDGTRQGYILDLVIFSRLPLLHINTKDKEASILLEEYIESDYFLDPNDIQKTAFSGTLGIRGRGNSTWTFPKKPFRLRLSEKTGFLGMPADKDWILLANYSDKTLMRNSLAFEMSRRFGLSYTPRSQYVELFMNGQYSGNYLLVEQIKVADHRLNIQILDKEDIAGNEVTGGYFMEIDIRLDADSYFYTSQKNIPFTLKSPDDLTPEQYNYIVNHINHFEKVLYSENYAHRDSGYAKYIDIESFINWYLVNEISKNVDAKFHTSVYLYKDRNEKLVMGPVWDFDIAFGNVSYNGNDNPEGWYIKEGAWFDRLFQDPLFNDKLKTRWNEIKNEEIFTLIDYIDQTSQELEFSQENNFAKWEILNKHVWPNAVVTGSYNGEVEYLKEWLGKRIKWLDAHINSEL